MAASVRPIAGGSYRTPTAFDALKVDDATKIVTDATPAIAKTNAKYMAGDHWQDGAGWIGPIPLPSNTKYAEVLLLIRRCFTSKNVIAEIVERHMQGVAGREPSWTLVPRREMESDETPTAEEQTLIDEANAALVEWWNNRKVHALIQEAVSRLLWAGRSPARLYVPPGYMSDVANATGTVTARTLRGALAKIYADAVQIESGTVFQDADSKQDLGILIAKKGDAVTVFLSHLEAIDPNADAGEEGNAPRLTVLRSITAGGSGATGAAVALDLGERLTMFEMRRPLLITQQVQEANKAINFANTTSPRALESSGFLERIITDAKINGKWVADPDSTDGETFVPTNVPQFGAGITTFLEGRSLEGGSGKVLGDERVVSPGVHWRPPTPITPIIEAKRAHYEDALEEADQVHVLISGESTPSGKSREEARADYRNSLSMTEAAATDFLRWLLETALAMAEAFVGDTMIGRYSRVLRVDARLRVTAGPVSVAERQQNAADVKDRILSRETAMDRADVADTDSENLRIESDPVSQYGTTQALAEAIKAMVDAGASFEGACLHLGLEPDEITKLLTRTEATAAGDDDPPGGDPIEGEDPPAPVVE